MNEEQERSDRGAGYSQPPRSAPQRPSHYHGEKSSFRWGSLADTTLVLWSRPQCDPTSNGTKGTGGTGAAKERSASLLALTTKDAPPESSRRETSGQAEVRDAYNTTWDPPKRPGQEGEGRDRH